ncbi:MAG TPA: hypothetical protein VGB14_06000 [Acidimicrobiales bacterium]
MVRAERIEAVDRAGRRRVRIGVIGQGLDGDDLVGMDVFDGRGRSTLTVALDDTGVACISFAINGDQAMVLGRRTVAGSHDQREPYVVLLNQDGAAIASLGGGGACHGST